jgi:hypothetical protein
VLVLLLLGAVDAVVVGVCGDIVDIVVDTAAALVDTAAALVVVVVESWITMDTHQHRSTTLPVRVAATDTTLPVEV